MTDRTQRRSPLAVQLLLLLAEKPMHAYRMQRLIEARHKDRIVNIAQRNSVYQTIDRLRRAELIDVAGTERAPGRPERTVYRITAVGNETVDRWLEEMLSAPAREFPEFPLALASLPHLTPDRAATFLSTRIEALEGRLRDAESEAEEAERIGLPRLFMIEGEYLRAMAEAELTWLRGIVGELRAETLQWDEDWLRTVSARFGDGGE